MIKDLLKKIKKSLHRKSKKNQTNIRIIKGRFDIKYIVYSFSALDNHIIKYGILNDWIPLNLNKFIPKNGVVFDVGANAGLLTLPFAKIHVPQGTVYAFEPDRQMARQLQINILLNELENVVFVPCALQDNFLIDELTFYIRRAIDGDGLANCGLSTTLQMPIHNVKKERVLSSTIDRYVEENSISKIDFIKIDVEGAESKVLLGSISTIKKDTPVILYEFSSVTDKLANLTNGLDSFNILKDIGYKQYEIVHEKYLREIEKPSHIMGDVNIICFHDSKVPSSISEYFGENNGNH